MLVWLGRTTEDERRQQPAFVTCPRSGAKGVRLSSFVSSRRYELACLGLACLLAIVATLANPVEAREDDLVMDFESRPWLHHALGTSVLHYEYTEPPMAGRPFDVSLEWAGSPAPSRRVAAQWVAPSQPAFGGPEALAASADTPLSTGANRRTFNLPNGLSKGMYYVRIEEPPVEGHPAAVFLKPIFYPGQRTPSSSPGWARIGNEMELRAVAVRHEQSDQLTVAFDWVALKPIAANYAVSLRLQDASGRTWVSLDTQPGYGFLPTSAWLPGENQHDRYTLGLPADMPHDGVFSLDVVWYRVASQQEIGRVRVPGIRVDSSDAETEIPPPPRNFGVPPMQHRVGATFGDLIRFLGYDLAQDGVQLTLTLHWQALSDMGTDYKFFVHVFDPATDRIESQVDAMPGGNAYPTSRWVKDEVVSERVEWELGSGVYWLATGWYDPTSADRLPALDAEGKPVLNDRLILESRVTLP
jgi:hypothetical protein